MEFQSPLVSGKLVQRYKRFLADIDFEDGREPVTVHVPNPGAMLGLATPGFTAYLSTSPNPNRKYKHTLEMIGWPDGTLIGVDTGHPNPLVVEAIENGLLPELAPYSTIRREVKYGKNSRIDILLERDEAPATYVEVKNVHLFREPGLAEFPDCVTARGAKHLEELGDMVELGHRAAMVFLVQANIADRFAIAADLDPKYSESFERAMKRGVEVFIVACELDRTGIKPVRQISLA